MTERPIRGANEVTPEWLTAILQEQGVLRHGRVTQVTASPPETGFSSLTWRLHVAYSGPVSPDVPGRLFLKCSRADLVPGERDTDKARKEIGYYQKLAPLMAHKPAVPRYAAALDPLTETSHLLLLDVSNSHRGCVNPCHPENPQRAMQALARLHAVWWDHPQLESLVGELPTQEQLDANWADGARRTEAFVATLGDRLPRHWRDTYTRVLRSLPNLYQRHLSRQNLTLVHGDAHSQLCSHAQPTLTKPTSLSGSSGTPPSGAPILRS